MSLFNPKKNQKIIVTDTWMRTCQECGYIGRYRNPRLYKDDSWLDVKCKKCGSEGLDYGSYFVVNDSKEEDNE